MGYTTEFKGHVTITPALSPEETTYINKFSDTRRMNRHKGPYFVDGSGDYGQGRDTDIIDYNTPPSCQPGLWCQWEASEDGTQIAWNGAEKFYHSAEWMRYLIDHFLGESPKAQSEIPCLTGGHVLNGRILAQGEDIEDRWELVVENNQVTTNPLA